MNRLRRVAAVLYFSVVAVTSALGVAVIVALLIGTAELHAQTKVTTPFNYEIHQLRSDITYVRVGDLQCLVVSGQVSCASVR